MFNHAPADYECPICIAVSGIENADTLISQSDIVHKDELVFAFISSFFIGNNPGHLIISPNTHFENIYDISNEILSHISKLSKRISIALKGAYDCDGVTILQNNEPEGGQHAFHYHLHVFPRYKDDNLHANMLEKRKTSAQERLVYVNKLKEKI